MILRSRSLIPLDVDAYGDLMKALLYEYVDLTLVYLESISQTGMTLTTISLVSIGCCIELCNLWESEVILCATVAAACYVFCTIWFDFIVKIIQLGLASNTLCATGGWYWKKNFNCCMYSEKKI